MSDDLRDEVEAIALSLISHTNAGKTTLARTLLARDVGEVRDAAHVTQVATPYPMIESPQGDALILWDTPGFGDSARLAKRLGQQGNPVGWFLAQVWDRFRDRPFWLSQQAVANVRSQADVVLYLVNASEEPGDAGYLAPELALLHWIGKPIIVLLNQTGPPRESAQEAADETRWRAAFAGAPDVRAVLALDAFARCWVQEFTLFGAVADALPDAKRPAFARLRAAWLARRMAQFDAAMEVLAQPIAQAACDRAVLPPERMLDKIGRAIGFSRERGESAAKEAQDTLAKRLDAELPASTDRLLALHGLDGRAGSDVQARLASDVRTEAPMDEGKAAMVGGAVSGALTGLAADLAAGGLTFGAGMLAGAMLGALGGAGVARGVNIVRGKNESLVRWEDAFLDGLVASALLRYLAVAHYGRGRGEWREAEYPSFWRELVAREVAAHRDRLAEVWATRTTANDAGQVDADAVAPMTAQLRPVMAGLAKELLAQLYPQATAWAAQTSGLGEPALS